MKFILLLTFVFAGGLILAQETFRVVKAQGCLKLRYSDTCLKKNDVLSLADSIVFGSPDDFAVLMDTAGEWATLKVKDTIGFSQGRELIFVASGILQQNRIDTTRTTRGKSGEKGSFKDLFGDDRFAVIGDEARLNISSREYLLNKDKYFVFDYTIDTLKIAKRLGFREQVVRIQKNRLCEFEGQEIPLQRIDNVNMYYYEPLTKAAELLASFDLVFISEEELFADFGEVVYNLSERKKKNLQTLYNALELYFYTYYGKTDPAALKVTIEKYIETISAQ